MPIDAVILDGAGRGRQARVSDQKALDVACIFPDVPPEGTPSRYRYYNALLGSTGADSGTTNMNVNGAVTPQVFYISAHADYDIHIMNIAILIADTAVVHNNFGNVGALANGWDLLVTEAGDDTYIIEGAQTGGQVIAYSGFARPYGNTATAWELTNWTGTEDAQTISIPISEYIPDGIRIGRGTLDRIESIVRDDLQGLTLFNVRIFGFRHLPGVSV